MSALFTGFFGFFAIGITVAGMVLLYLKVLPKKYDGSFRSKILQMVHDYFSFKKLYLESALKFLFTLLTVACIACGVSIILAACIAVFGNISYIARGYMSFSYLFTSFFGQLILGALVTVLGPAVVRLVYEGMMMFILMVKNVIELNNKTKDANAKAEEIAE